MFEKAAIQTGARKSISRHSWTLRNLHLICGSCAAYLAQDLVTALAATLRYCPVLTLRPISETAWLPRCATALCWPPSLSRGWRQSWTSLSPWGGTVADINTAAADQSAGLVECYVGTQSLGVSWWDSAAGTCQTTGRRDCGPATQRVIKKCVRINVHLTNDHYRSIGPAGSLILVFDNCHREF